MRKYLLLHSKENYFWKIKFFLKEQEEEEKKEGGGGGVSLRKIRNTRAVAQSDTRFTYNSIIRVLYDVVRVL